MGNKKYKKHGKVGMFDTEFAKQDLSNLGNPLEKIIKVLDFEIFRDILENGLLNKNRKNNAGAKRYDVVMLFKILILQRFYGLGDKQVEYQIIDRTSFKTFLGLSSGDKVPDSKTVWLFREELTKAGLVEKIFNQFKEYLASKELIFNEGKIIDASFTTAEVHDSQILDKILDKEEDGDQPLYADSAYVGEKQEEIITAKKMSNEVCQKGFRNKPLSADEKKKNRMKSKVRSRVEHVFGFMEQSMHGLFLRSIGIKRATGIIGLINLTYNICRYEQIIRLQIL